MTDNNNGRLLTFLLFCSSRFTDSKKYEADFIPCFLLQTPRQGEICNACVLLVKRFKRLPPGSDRHWGHVVDARVGPGLKSMTKFKKQQRKEESNNVAAAARLVSGVQPTEAAAALPNGAQLPAAGDSSNNSNDRKLRAPKVAPDNEGTVQRCSNNSSCIPQKFRKIVRKPKKVDQRTVLAERSEPPQLQPQSRSDDLNAYLNDSSDFNLFDLRQQLTGTRMAFNGHGGLREVDDPMLAAGQMMLTLSHRLVQHVSPPAAAQPMQISSHFMRRKSRRPPKQWRQHNPWQLAGPAAADTNWIGVKTCCGLVYENKTISAVIIDPDQMSKCENHVNKNQMNNNDNKSHIINGGSDGGAHLVKNNKAAAPRIVSTLSPIRKLNINAKKSRSLIAAAKVLLPVNQQVVSMECSAATNEVSPATAIVPQQHQKLITTMCPATMATTTTTAAAMTPRSMAMELVQRINGGGVAGENNNKFSDNSSDSGYEELSSLSESVRHHLQFLLFITIRFYAETNWPA